MASDHHKNRFGYKTDIVTPPSPSCLIPSARVAKVKATANAYTPTNVSPYLPIWS